MIYCLAIDWLAFFCESETGCLNEYIPDFGYRLEPHGTRQYRQLITVTLHGIDLFEVQQLPCSSILNSKSMIIKVCNRWLYQGGLWYLVNKFLSLHRIRVLNISRVDICADFNNFHGGLSAVSLIEGFLSAKYRHIGRGIGNAHFNHFSKKDGKFSRSHVNYTGLSFGSNESAARAYLYNKSFELMTVKDKPWIREMWKECGLENTPQKPVWRLEISIKSKGMKFKDKEKSDIIKIDENNVQNSDFIKLMYHTFVHSLFSFVRNRESITNISREPRMQLFNGEPFVKRCALSNESAGNRAERILIKALWQMSEKYRGNNVVEDEGISKLLATNLAQNTGLLQWLIQKRETWSQPNKQ